MLAGLSLLGHSIAAGRDAHHVDRVYVSTEDPRIAQASRDLGAEVIDRPSELATDSAQNDAVAVHALEAIRRTGFAPDVLVLLQPTSPLRNADHVDECVAALLKSNARSAMSVCPVEHHPGKCVLIKDGLLRPFTTDHDMEARRQALPEVFRQNGAIYAVRSSDLLAGSRFFIPPCVGYVMPKQLSIDIDDETDLQFAALVLSRAAKT